MKFKKKVIFSIVALILCLVFLEISAYAIYKLSGHTTEAENKRDWKGHYKTSGLYENIDIEKFYQEQKEVWSDVDFDFYRYYRPKDNFKGEYISTDEFGFRETVQHLKPNVKQTRVVAFFGGSTMWGDGTEYDGSTIPSFFGKYINGKDPKTNYIVKNYGVGGYHNMQEIIVLLEKIGFEQIDFAVFYDWVNESVFGLNEVLDNYTGFPFMQPSVYTGYEGMIKFLQERGLRRGKMFAVLDKVNNVIKKSYIIKTLLNIKNLWKPGGKRAEEELEPELDEREEKQAERVVSLYEKNKRIITSLSNGFNFTPYFIMQPTLFTKKRHGSFEKDSSHWKAFKSIAFEKKLYQLARAKFGHDNDFFDISSCITTDETIYIDDHHTSGKGNEMIAKSILERIGDRIINASMTH